MVPPRSMHLPPWQLTRLHGARTEARSRWPLGYMKPSGSQLTPAEYCEPQDPSYLSIETRGGGGVCGDAKLWHPSYFTIADCSAEQSGDADYQQPTAAYLAAGQSGKGATSVVALIMQSRKTCVDGARGCGCLNRGGETCHQGVRVTL